MSKQDNKDRFSHANLERGDLESAASRPFNAEVERGQEIAAASDRAKEVIADRTAIRDSRMERQLENETKFSGYCIQREKAKLMEKQLSSPQPIPTDAAAREVMQKELDEGAVRNYEKNQAFKRDQIEWQYKADVDEILRMDREGRLPEQERTHEHQQER